MRERRRAQPDAEAGGSLAHLLARSVDESPDPSAVIRPRLAGVFEPVGALEPPFTDVWDDQGRPAQPPAVREDVAEAFGRLEPSVSSLFIASPPAGPPAVSAPAGMAGRREALAPPATPPGAIVTAP